jgi:uncharacterized Zn-binding protein involved in type VI secretion
MAAAVRMGDRSAGHCFFPRPNISGSPNVFINGLGAHTLGGKWPIHICGKKKHTSTTSQGSPNVFINGKAMARVGDKLNCGDACAQGSPNVFVN